MNLRVNLPDNLEQKLKEQASAVGLDVEAFVVATIQEALDEVVSPKPKLTVAEFNARLQRIIDRNSSEKIELDDSRDSIYEGTT